MYYTPLFLYLCTNYYNDKTEIFNGMAKRKTPKGPVNLDIPDFGNMDELFDASEIDLSVFDIVGKDEAVEALPPTRYLTPRLETRRSEPTLYDNAVELARKLRLSEKTRADVLVNGNFIFGDFIEAYVKTYNIKCRKMTISTLSMSEANVESLRNLLTGHYVDELNLVISVYFYGNYHDSIIPYLYQRLDYEDRFQLAVAGIHTKTAQFETLGGKKIIMHGSANLRSSQTVEQFTIEENAELYDFYDEAFDNIIEKYHTINKAVRHSALWDTLTRKKFDD